MKIITAHINPNDTGTEVQNLQNVLTLFLDNQFIRTFQPPDSPDAEEVINLRKALATEYQSGIYGGGTKQLVLYFQMQQGLGDWYHGTVEVTTARKMNEILVAMGAIKIDNNNFIVKGFIRNHKGEGVVNALVRLYDRDLRTRELLGETNTNETGYYELEYGYDNFKKSEKDNADLMVEAFDENGERQVNSEIFYNAPPLQEINLALPPPPTPPEWKLINDQLLPLLTGQFIDLSSTGIEVFIDLKPELLKKADLEFISKETGIDANLLLSFWSFAYMAGGIEQRITPEIFYGWFRLDLPTLVDDLFAISWNDDKPPHENIPEKFIDVLGEAVAKNIISSSIDANYLHGQLFPIIYSIISEHLIEKSKNGAPASIGDLLEIAGISDDGDKMRIAQHIRNQRPFSTETDKFYEMLLGSDVHHETRILFPKIFVLDSLTKHYLPLIQMLFTAIPNPNPGTHYYPFVDPFVYTDFLKGVKNDIKSLSLSGLELVKQVGAPIYFEGSNQTEKELNYATYLDSIINTD